MIMYYTRKHCVRGTINSRMSKIKMEYTLPIAFNMHTIYSWVDNDNK